MFKFIKAMQEAVDLGVAEPEDLVPDWSRKRLHNKSLQSIRSQRNDVQASDTDVGVSKNLDLESYSLRALPGESPESHFKRLCRHRARGGPIQVPRGCHIEITPLQLRILSPSDADLRIGSLLKEANRRMNILGEVDGLCRQANTEKRLAQAGEATKMYSRLSSYPQRRKSWEDGNRGRGMQKAKQTSCTRRQDSEKESRSGKTRSQEEI